jgi:hypothetical protein
MVSNNYHFTTTWRVEGTVEEVARVLGNGPDLARWWPSVYLHVQEQQPGDERGIGKVISLYTKGWLPYTLRWKFRITEVRDDGFALQAWGDFDGSGNWTFHQDGRYVDIVYDWKIRADKPLLQLLSPIMKPFFAANHRWAMEKGEQSLKLELARRRAATAQERALVPAPPQPTTSSAGPLLLGLAGALGLAILLGRRRRA